MPVTIESRLIRHLRREGRRRRSTIESCVHLTTRFAIPREERHPLPGHDGAVDPGRTALLNTLKRVHDQTPAGESSGES